MTATTFALYTRQIADHLLRCSREEQRRTFAALVEFISRETGGEFDSVHDFLTTDATEIPVERRREILATICQALKDGDLGAFEQSLIP